MTSRRRWIVVAGGLLLAVWTSIYVYRENPIIPMPDLVPTISVVHCSTILPADLWVQGWVPEECFVPEP